MSRHVPITAGLDPFEAVQAQIADLMAFKARAEPLLARLEPKSPKPEHVALFALIVAVITEGERFRCGDYCDDPKQAQRWGQALAGLLPFSPVSGFEIRREAGRGHHAAWWVIRYVGEPGGSGS